MILFLNFVVPVAAQQAVTVFDMVRNDDIFALKQLLQKQPSVCTEVTPEGYSPLIIACYRGKNEIAKVLVQNGCDVNVRSSMGTALMACIVKGNTEMALYLMEHKANLNLTDDDHVTPLIFATMFKNKKLVSHLLAKGADKSIKDKQGKTAFEYAVFSGDEELINLLK